MVSIHLLVLLTMTMKMINGEYPSTGSVDDDNGDD